MAFGSSWEVTQSHEKQIRTAGRARTGSMGEAVFETESPDLYNSMLYLFAVR